MPAFQTTSSEEEIAFTNIPKNKPFKGWISYLPLLILGFNALTTQIILLREMVSIFNGNELVIGIIMANWLLITGAGSYFGRYSYRIKKKTSFLLKLFILLILLPTISAFFLNYLKNILFPIGVLIQIHHILICSFVILFPFCFISGFLFPFLSDRISEKNQAESVKQAYGIESAGSILGGIVFNLVLIYFFPTFKSLLLIALINFTMLLFYSYIMNHRKAFIPLLSFIFIIFAILIFTHPDKKIKSYLFPNQQILITGDSPYGNITITESAGQINFYENNVLLFNSENTLLNEESVHFAMLQRPDAENVLLVSGGISGMIAEILKYPVSTIDYLEMNKYIMNYGKSFVDEYELTKVTVIHEDLRTYISHCKKKYDVILLNLPDPSSLQLNRFYTLEFFRQLKERLTDRGVLMFSLSPTGNYLNTESIVLHSTIYNTCKNAFSDFIIIPGEKNYYLLSEGNLSLEISALYQSARITGNEYVNQHYFDDNLLRQRSNFILHNLDRNAPFNTDFKPVSYHWQLKLWLSQFRINYSIFVGILILSFLAILFFAKPVSLAIVATGISSTAFELLLITGFQITYGNLHHHMGILFTLFMAGLSTGALLNIKFFENKIRNKFVANQLVIGLFSLLLTFVITIIIPGSHDFLKAVFFILSFIAGLMTGVQFALASKVSIGVTTQKAGILYSADLAGSALGSLAVTVVLIPMAGIVLTGFFVLALNVLVGLYLLINRN